MGPAMGVNDDIRQGRALERVGGAGGVGLHEGRNDGNWPHSFRGARSLSFKLFEMSRALQDLARRGVVLHFLGILRLSWSY